MSNGWVGRPVRVSLATWNRCASPFASSMSMLKDAGQTPVLAAGPRAICVGCGDIKGLGPFRDPLSPFLTRLATHSARVTPWSSWRDPTDGGDLRRRYVYLRVGEPEPISAEDAESQPGSETVVTGISLPESKDAGAWWEVEDCCIWPRV